MHLFRLFPNRRSNKTSTHQPQQASTNQLQEQPEQIPSVDQHAQTALDVQPPHDHHHHSKHTTDTQPLIQRSSLSSLYTIVTFDGIPITPNPTPVPKNPIEPCPLPVQYTQTRKQSATDAISGIMMACSSFIDEVHGESGTDCVGDWVGTATKQDQATGPDSVNNAHECSNDADESQIDTLLDAYAWSHTDASVSTSHMSLSHATCGVSPDHCHGVPDVAYTMSNRTLKSKPSAWLLQRMSSKTGLQPIHYSNPVSPIDIHNNHNHVNSGVGQPYPYFGLDRVRSNSVSGGSVCTGTDTPGTFVFGSTLSKSRSNATLTMPTNQSSSSSLPDLVSQSSNQHVPVSTTSTTTQLGNMGWVASMTRSVRQSPSPASTHVSSTPPPPPPPSPTSPYHHTPHALDLDGLFDDNDEDGGIATPPDSPVQPPVNGEFDADTDTDMISDTNGSGTVSMSMHAVSSSSSVVSDTVTNGSCHNVSSRSSL